MRDLLRRIEDNPPYLGAAVAEPGARVPSPHGQNLMRSLLEKWRLPPQGRSWWRGHHQRHARARVLPDPRPHLQAAIDNYARLLEALGRSPPEVAAQLDALCRPYGIQLGGQS